jgi:hypothetical protein
MRADHRPGPNGPGLVQEFKIKADRRLSDRVDLRNVIVLRLFLCGETNGSRIS